jgi:hypothetical protein
MQLFPVLMSRNCSISVEEIEQMGGDFKNQYLEFQIVKKGYDSQRDSLLAKLFSEIEKEDDYAKKINKIKLKRNIFNGRKLDFELLLSESDPIFDDLLKFEQHKLNYDASATQLNKLIEMTEGDLNVMVNLIKSSRNVFESLPFLSSSFYDEVRLKSSFRKRMRTVRTLVKLIFRASFKPSPFAGLTTLSFIPLVDGPTHGTSFDVRLNIAFAKYFANYIITGSNLRWFFPFHLNNSLKKIGPENYEYLYLTDLNIEVLNKVKATPSIEFLINLFKERRTQDFREISKSFQSEFDLEEAGAVEHLTNLIERGLIVTGFHRLFLKDNWEGILLRIVNSKKFIDTEFTQLRAFLELIIDIRARAKLGSQISEEKLTTALSLLKEFVKEQIITENTQKYESVDQSLKTMTISKLFYLDVFEENKITPAFKGEIKEIMAEYLDFLNIQARDHPDYLSMLFFHKIKYDHKPVSFVHFYKDYFSSITLGHDISLKAKIVEQVDAINAKLERELSFRAKSYDHMYSPLNHEYHLQHNRTNNNDQILNASSYGAFLQFFQETGQVKCVHAEGTFPGYGRMMSRFLNHSISEPYLNIQRKWNKAMEDDGVLLAEISDNAYHNYNLHPPLLSALIDIPRSSQAYPIRNLIPIRELFIDFDKRSGRAVLLHGKKTVQCFDLNFQSSEFRSQIFNHLQLLANRSYLNNFRLINALNSRNSISKDGIVIHPRIIVNSRVIIQRKTWKVAFEVIKGHVESIESMISFFEHHKFPTENFYRIIYPQASKKREKPQYLDIFNRFTLFNFLNDLRISKNEIESVEFSEAIPNRRSVSQLDTHFREYLIQWTNKVSV